MIAVAYYTQGSSYEREADLLCASLDRVGMAYEVTGIASHGDWYANTARKATFLQGERERLPGPLLYLDVDAFVHEDCSAYFDALADEGYDFAAHWWAGPKFGHDQKQVRRKPDGSLDGWWMLSGTMLLGDTDGCRDLLVAWVAKNADEQRKGNRVGGGQANLAECVRTLAGRLKVARLPGRYTYVFDKPWGYPAGEPCIIEHTIASREHRDKERRNADRCRRIEELRRIVQQEAA